MTRAPSADRFVGCRFFFRAGNKHPRHMCSPVKFIVICHIRRLGNSATLQLLSNQRIDNVSIFLNEASLIAPRAINNVVSSVLRYLDY